MAKELTDDELNLRRKARRRLIGAIALTLAVVVILPMVLDSEPKPNTQDIDLRIPNPDKVGEFVPGVAVSEVVAEALPLAESAVVPASAVAAVSAPAAVSTVAHSPVAAETGKPVVNETKANASNQPQPAAARSEGKQDGGYAAQVGAYSNAATAKQELDKLKKWGFKAYTEKAGDKIRVRVGPYAERGKAEKVAKLLEKHGLHPSIVSAK